LVGIESALHHHGHDDKEMLEEEERRWKYVVSSSQLQSIMYSGLTSTHRTLMNLIDRMI